MNSWKGLPEFRGATVYFQLLMMDANFELKTCGANFCFDELAKTIHNENYPRLNWLGLVCETTQEAVH